MAKKSTEGKSKKVRPISVGIVYEKDDMTAGNGKRHEVIPGKGALCNRINSYLSELFAYCGIPVAYIALAGITSFYAYLCTMIPIEIVVRGRAHGSILKREPHLVKDQEFDVPIVEFYLKTKNKRWGRKKLPCDDPLIRLCATTVVLYHPDVPSGTEGSKIRELSFKEVFKTTSEEEGAVVMKLLQHIAGIAARAYLVLRSGFRKVGFILLDSKVECGVDSDGEVRLADDVTPDSLRLNHVNNRTHYDKQLFRDGRPVEEVMRAYEAVAHAANRINGYYGDIRREHPIGKKVEFVSDFLLEA